MGARLTGNSACILYVPENKMRTYWVTSQTTWLMFSHQPPLYISTAVELWESDGRRSWVVVLALVLLRVLVPILLPTVIWVLVVGVGGFVVVVVTMVAVVRRLERLPCIRIRIRVRLEHR